MQTWPGGPRGSGLDLEDGDQRRCSLGIEIGLHSLTNLPRDPKAAGTGVVWKGGNRHGGRFGCLPSSALQNGIQEAVLL